MPQHKDTLFIIPARGGSKGIPHKNIKPFAGKPLISYAIECARACAEDTDICVSTDDPEIIKVVEESGLKVPFVRPAYLATDNCGTYEVLLHALNHYESQGIIYDKIVLMQPTSPLRKPTHVKEAISLYSNDLDMVVSVKETEANPYFNCFEENSRGYLSLSKGDGSYARRQDCPKAYQYNGAVYVINCESLKKMKLSQFPNIKKYVMDDLHSIDLDTPLDWKLAELIASETSIL